MVDLLVGLDAAASIERCGYAFGRLTSNGICIDEARLLEGPCETSESFERLAQVIGRHESVVIAIDAPLGWPAVLGPTMSAHRAGQQLLPRRSALFRRRTDESVRRMTGKIPLDVGAEKIAHAAHQALDLLERLRILTSRPIPLARSPRRRDF